MISILRSTAEVDAVCEQLKQRGLSLHKTRQKNWDHHQLLELLKDVPKDASIFDMGSGGGFTIKVLHESGFSNLRGFDLEAPQRRIKHKLMRMLSPSTFQPRFVIEDGDICSTGQPAESADFMTCVSVLEHGVDVDAFLKEAARLLRPGGVLFVTVDYWEDYQPPADAIPAVCGLPWNIFNRDTLQEMLKSARAHGLETLSSEKIPLGEDKPVHYGGQEYTFAALALKKPKSAR